MFCDFSSIIMTFSVQNNDFDAGPSPAFLGPRALKILGARDTKIGLQNIKNKKIFNIKGYFHHIFA